MYLENLNAPAGFVITGVAFQCSKEPSPEGGCFGLLELKIRVTLFDYFEGRLIEDSRTEWRINTHDPVTGPIEIRLDNSDLPTKSPKNRVDWAYGHYVKFQRSDLSKDAAQSMVPFFDVQDVEGELEFPLGAIGILHRGHEGYGGFLAFKINTIHVGQYFKMKFDED
ncbi:hypothetical protein G9C98_003037 [Cotesia typhae]|uniref:Uncharacterized protein n=1 Tax=Cotesia typhae TaxID=2053667 RepID=A0A8J5UXJ8_9HYME|nr:hypothetical protein G9C98_003037 [Cotesia typhae]